jgi:hypothetical protein
MWKGLIDAAFAAYGVSLPVTDQFYGQIRAAGTDTKPGAVTQDMQCRACETLQDTPASGLPHSLVQRAQAPASPTKQAYVGAQFQHTSMDQMVELTKVKIEDVVGRIRQLLGSKPTAATGARPPTHPIYVNIVDPGNTDALLSKLSTDALAAATAAAPPGSYANPSII